MKGQAEHIYREVESGYIINIETLRQDIEQQQQQQQQQQLSRIDDTSGDINMYRDIIVNNAGKTDTVLSQVEQWSILSSVINYIQYDRHPKNFHSLNISAVDKEKGKERSNSEREMKSRLELDFEGTKYKLREEYLDVYKVIHSEILSITKFDENSDLSTIYLGRVDRSKNNKMKAEESFPISEQRYTVGKLLDGTEYQILLDTGASKSFMSKITLFAM